jgi:AAA ATPase containing von Willebrand factor type A (vWA) domain
METTDKRNSSVENRDPRNQNLNRQNAVLNEKLYNNDEMKMSIRQENLKNQGNTRNGYDPNKAIPDHERITNEDDLDDLDDDFHQPGDLVDDADELNDEYDNPSDNINDDFNNPEDEFEEEEYQEEEEEELDDHTHTTGDLLYDENAENLNDEIDNPSDDEELTESDEDLQELDPEDDDLEDDLEPDEIEEEDSGDNYPDNDPRKF